MMQKDESVNQIKGRSLVSTEIPLVTHLQFDLHDLEVSEVEDYLHKAVDQETIQDGK